MVDAQVVARGISDPRVVAALRKVPRHLFVPPARRAEAYEDHPIPIGYGQTISQPYIVALMTEALALAPAHRVLEVGTGSGYQAAVLAELCRRIDSIEVVPELGQRAAETLAALGYTGVSVHVGDGYEGLLARAPFDRIIVTAAPPTLPQALCMQLGDGGRMVIPVGAGAAQSLRVLTRSETNWTDEILAPVRFVPMVRPGAG